ncbi:MAG: hypothetical protein R2727_00695 [Bacteroidales bacterium]
MKKVLLITITVLVTGIFATAQEVVTEKVKKSRDYSDDQIRTLFGRHRSNGGYGAFWMGYSIVDERHALQFGGRGSWVIQHSFAIGFGGTGFINENHYDAILDKNVFLTGGYGGLYRAYCAAKITGTCCISRAGRSRRCFICLIK